MSAMEKHFYDVKDRISISRGDSRVDSIENKYIHCSTIIKIQQKSANKCFSKELI